MTRQKMQRKALSVLLAVLMLFGGWMAAGSVFTRTV